MAKVMISIEDDGNGEVDIRLESDLPSRPEMQTPAHRLAAGVMLGAFRLRDILKTSNTFFKKKDDPNEKRPEPVRDQEKTHIGYS